MLLSLILLGVVLPSYSLVNAKCAFYHHTWYKPMRWCYHSGSQLFVGDFNGDKRDDMLCHDKAGRKYIALARKAGTFFKNDWYRNLGWCRHKNGRLFIGDFNGDKRKDMLCHDVGNGYKWIAFANKRGHFTGTGWHRNLKWCFHGGSKLFIGDFNGDGRDDMLCHDKQGRKWIAFANKYGHFTGTNWYRNMGWCRHAGSRLYIGDFNGDGRSDMLCHDTAARMWIALAGCQGHFTATTWHRGNFRWCSKVGKLFIGDFNADGKSDVLCHHTKTGQKWIAYSKGKGHFTGTDWYRAMGWCVHSGAKIFIGDYNGDKLDDMLCHDRQGRKWIAYGECY